MTRIIEVGFYVVVLTLSALRLVAAEEFGPAWPDKREYDDPAVTKAMEAVRAGIAACREDPTRPVYHFRPQARWMNDICGAIFFKGYYHIFLDKSVMEVFVNNGRACVTRVVYPGQHDLALEVFAEGGRVTLRSLDVWQMTSILPPPGRRDGICRGSY